MELMFTLMCYWGVMLLGEDDKLCVTASVIFLCVAVSVFFLCVTVSVFFLCVTVSVFFLCVTASVFFWGVTNVVCMFYQVFVSVCDECCL